MDLWITAHLLKEKVKRLILVIRSVIWYSCSDKKISFPRPFFHQSCLYLCFRSWSRLGIDHALCHWGYFVQDVGPHLTGTKVSTCSINPRLIIHNFQQFKNIPTFIPRSMSFFLPPYIFYQSLQPPRIPPSQILYIFFHLCHLSIPVSSLTQFVVYV